MVGRLLLEPEGNSDALLQCSQRAAKRAIEIGVKRYIHELGRIGMPDMAAIPHCIAFIDLPHDTVAVRASENRPAANAIHLAHNGMSVGCDVNLVSDCLRYRHLRSHRFTHEAVEQSR